jgi:hypothetical protein
VNGYQEYYHDSSTGTDQESLFISQMLDKCFGLLYTLKPPPIRPNIYLILLASTQEFKCGGMKTAVKII